MLARRVLEPVLPDVDHIEGVGEKVKSEVKLYTSGAKN